MLQQENQAQVTTPAIQLPGDQFAHVGAPTEWWWHVGTLHADDGRTFGFEVNAVGMLANEIIPTSYAYTQIEITDVEKQCNYQKVTSTVPLPTNWAQYDQSQPWFVNLPQNDGNGAVAMSAIGGNPLNMLVQASFIDVNPVTGVQTACQISLNLYQQGAPLLVWGTGCQVVNPAAPTPITQNNYYYSLTNLQASGTLTIGGEVINVTGVTWMDHEYGAFPDGSTGKVIWLLQDIQFGDGLHLSNYTKFGLMPQENVPMPSNATLLFDGVSTFVDTITTPMGPTYVSAKGVTYYMNYKVQLKDFPHLYFLVHSSYPNQVFRDPGSSPDVYEGVGTAEMIFEMSQRTKIVVSSGPAWVEQNLG